MYRSPSWEKRRHKLVKEGHRLIELMWPRSSTPAYEWLAFYMKVGEKKHNAHFTYMDNDEAAWAVALLKNRAWRKGIETPEAEIH